MSDLPKRKPNRLHGYNYLQNGAYFITICVKGRRESFGKIVGGDAHIAPNIFQLSEYGIAAEKYITGIMGIDKYVIMPNHVHMIICIYPEQAGTMWASSPTTRQSISQLVKSYKTLVSKEIGYSVWQRSFHDHIIRNEKEYQEIWRYIDENPLKWEEDSLYDNHL